MQEGVHGQDTSGGANGAELRRQQRERDRQYQYRYQRQLRKNASPELKARMRIHNAKQRPKTLLGEQRDKAAFKHYCDICKVNSRNAADQRKHLSGDTHEAIVQMGGADHDGWFSCPTCPGKRFQTSRAFGRHIKSKAHVGSWLLSFIRSFYSSANTHSDLTSTGCGLV